VRHLLERLPRPACDLRLWLMLTDVAPVVDTVWLAMGPWFACAMWQARRDEREQEANHWCCWDASPGEDRECWEREPRGWA
jgi:hypothetical protein